MVMAAKSGGTAGLPSRPHDPGVVCDDTLAGMVEAVRERAARAVDELELVLPAVPAPIPVVDFTEAQTLVERSTGESIIGEPDLAPAHERWLGGWAAREHGSDFLFVTGYPMAKRPFYTRPDPHRPAFSNSFDLLFRGTELVTGGQRRHRSADYLTRWRARTLSRSRATSRHFATGCPRTAGSRSAWSAGPHASPAR
jgi:nondiscriminating aspartyl-tRNA synthetase